MIQSTKTESEDKPLEALQQQTSDEIGKQVEHLVEAELELERLAEEEFALLSAYVSEDAQGVKKFWTELCEEFVSLERRTGHWLLKAADAANVDISHWQSRIRSPGVVLVAGDQAGDKSLVCLCCGHQTSETDATRRDAATKEALIRPCEHCSGVYFQQESTAD